MAQAGTGTGITPPATASAGGIEAKAANPIAPPKTDALPGAADKIAPSTAAAAKAWEAALHETSKNG